MRIGSLFSGYGGLDMGVQAVIGGHVAWHVEFDPAPSKILAHRFPGVPNHGDITTVDWAAVEPVEVLTGGFPCQDVSLAGLRRGLKDGTRSGLWSHYAVAIDRLRPQLVVIENVRGLLSAKADRGMESDPWNLGDGNGGPALRALGAVLGDLADLGYDAGWCGVRAADAGAPHSRFRVFVLAYPCGIRSQWWSGRTEGSSTIASSLSPDASRQSRCVGNGNDVRPRGREDEQWSTAGRSTATDAAGSGRDRRPQDQVGETLGRAPTAWSRGAASPSANPHRDGLEGIRGFDAKRRNFDGFGGADSIWGDYQPAIRRWERTLGRVAPSPTEPTGKGGAQRLSPVFVEWMMGLPEGWLTAPEVGLTRNQQLKALGNGVVPQQAALAVATLLNAEAVAA